MHWVQGWVEVVLSTFSWLYLLVCAVVQKYHEKLFLKKFFLHSFCNQPVFCITWKRKRTMKEQCTVHVNERNQTKTKENKVASHSNWSRILLFDLVYKKCSGIIKGWLHCLTSESKGRFLTNKIYLPWCLVMAQIQSLLIRKIKTESSGHSLSLHPLRPITPHFCLTPHHPPPSKGTSYVYHHLPGFPRHCKKIQR